MRPTWLKYCLLLQKWSEDSVAVDNPWEYYPDNNDFTEFSTSMKVQHGEGIQSSRYQYAELEPIFDSIVNGKKPSGYHIGV